MGSELLGEDSTSHNSRGVGDTKKRPTLSYTDVIYQCLPHYLAMGMSADEFWNCDPRMYEVYREKDRLENERKNEQYWVQMAYVYQALVLTAPMFNSLKPQPPEPYPNKPFELNLGGADDKELTDEGIKNSKQYAKVMSWALAVNKQKELQNGKR